MTGNTVLLGIALVRSDGGQALRSALAFGGFVVGVLVATALRRLQRQVSTEAVLLGAAAALAAVANLPAIAVAAAAMGVQSAATRDRTPPGVNLTYLTGTTTSLAARWTDRLLGRPADRPALPGWVWLFYFAGAISGAALFGSLAAAGFVVPAVVVATLALSLVRVDDRRANLTEGTPASG